MGISVSGRCECGATHYTCTARQEEVSECRCADCLRGSSALDTECLIVDRHSISVHGTFSTYTGNDSASSERVFCALCGTMIYAIEASGDRGAFVHVATLRAREPLN